MSWSWGVFVAALIGCTILVMWSRGAMNASNVAKYGQKADYYSNPGSAFAGSMMAGAILATVITAIVGLFR